MEKSKNKALRYKWHCNAWDIGGKNEDTGRTGTIEAVLGECEDIEGFPKLKITNITENKITIEWVYSIQYLTPGSYVEFHHEEDGYEDHDGVLWNGYTYSLIIFWDE